MYHATKAYLAATNELLAMHINMATRRSEAFPPGVHERLTQMKSAHSAFALPPQVGRTLGFRVK
jgi:acyl-CoA thioester hydrolase